MLNDTQIHKYKIQRWLGLTDMGREGEWVWLHSSQVEQKIFQRKSKGINPRYSFPLVLTAESQFHNVGSRSSKWKEEERRGLRLLRHPQGSHGLEGPSLWVSFRPLQWSWVVCWIQGSECSRRGGWGGLPKRGGCAHCSCQHLRQHHLRENRS